MPMPTKFTVAPGPNDPVEDGIYEFGFNDEASRKALNFRREMLSYSRLKRFVRPVKVSAYVAGVGDLVGDTLLFGPDAIPAKYQFHGEQIKYNTREGKAFRDTWQAANPGRVLIRPKERAEAARLIEAAYANPQCKKAIEMKGLVEVGAVASVGGVRYRSWLDKLTKDCIIDVKTSRCESPESFLDAVMKYGYDTQAALYLDQCEALGLGQLRYFWLVCSKTSGRAWMQELTPLHYASGHRWIADMTDVYKTQQGLDREIADLTKINADLSIPF